MRIMTMLLFALSVSTQLFDVCSNNNVLNQNKDLCLNIFGCCFTEIEIGGNVISSCFRRFKSRGRDTCEDYLAVTKLFGNDLKTCECNDSF
jgi:hypothetical protein